MTAADIAIVGLLGRKGSGKSTVARYLVDRYGAQVVSFATPLKDMADVFVRSLIERHSGLRVHVPSGGELGPFHGGSSGPYTKSKLSDPAWKEGMVCIPYPSCAGCEDMPEDSHHVELFTLRWFMMTLGTEMCRQHLGANVWVNAALDSMQRARVDSGQRLFVIDDVRFLSEVEMIRANNGVIIKLTCTDDPVPTGQVHASEDVDSISARLIDEAVASHRSPNSDHLLHEFSQALERMFDASVVDQPSDACRARAAVRAALQSPRG